MSHHHHHSKSVQFIHPKHLQFLQRGSAYLITAQTPDSPVQISRLLRHTQKNSADLSPAPKKRAPFTLLGSSLVFQVFSCQIFFFACVKVPATWLLWQWLALDAVGHKVWGTSGQEKSCSIGRSVPPVGGRPTSALVMIRTSVHGQTRLRFVSDFYASRVKKLQDSLCSDIAGVSRRREERRKRSLVCYCLGAGCASFCCTFQGCTKGQSARDTRRGETRNRIPLVPLRDSEEALLWLRNSQTPQSSRRIPSDEILSLPVCASITSTRHRD